MRSGLLLVVLSVGLLLGAAGCTSASRLDLAERTGGNAALFGQFRAYDGRTGKPLSFADVVRRCARADVVLFGEEHGAAVCNQLEAQLLGALLAEKRPVTLAMEFFEADTQADLDAYLRGRLDEEAFREQARQGRAYTLSHRPLIELCRVSRSPVVAANAPRRLVSAYRKSGDTYDVFRAGLEPAEKRWLPVECEYVHGTYEERFMGVMSGHVGGGMRRTATTQPAATSQPTSAPAGMMGGMAEEAADETAGGTRPTEEAATQPAGESQPSSAPVDVTSETAGEARPTAASQSTTQPSMQPATQPSTQPAESPASQPVGGPPPGMNPRAFYQAQLLWDQAMAEAIADVREQEPARRVMLVVGGFHVASEGGTAVKLHGLRPRDRVCTVVYQGTSDGALAFDETDRDAGDIIIYGMEPPPKEELARMPKSMPTTTQPTTQPATTAPASMPSSASPTTDKRGL